MLYQEEKFKKWIKVSLIVLGLVLVYGLFNFFIGGISSKSSINVNPGGLGYGGMMSDKTSGMVTQNSVGSRTMAPDSSSFDNIVSPMMESVGSSDGGVILDDNSATVITDKKIIKNGDLMLKVESAQTAIGKITDIVKNKGGEVFSTNFSENTKGRKNGYMTVKVPVDKFEQTVKELKTVATQVLNESTDGQDVTEQYTDLQAQLKNKRAEEESFVKILGTAGKIDDVLSATREVARVRGEIERLEGRVRFMDSQTDMSTITINLTEDVTVTPVKEGWRPWQVVKQSANELITSMQNLVDGIIRFIIVGIPSLVPFVFFVWLLYWSGKKVFKKINL